MFGENAGVLNACSACSLRSAANMTKEEEIPDWVGAKEFYDKYEPKEILGRYVYETVVVT